MITGKFPELRLRRLRKNETIRRMVRENHLSVDDFIYPLFIVEGKGVKEEIPSMPGKFRYSVDTLTEEVERIKELGIKAIILFGIPGHKDEVGSDSFSDEGIIQRAVRSIKKNVPEMYVIKIGRAHV